MALSNSTQTKTPKRAHKLRDSLDAINRTLGQCVSWLIAIMAIVVFTLVVSRNLFNMGSIAAQESILYLHALAFLLSLGYTANADGHVRVDIFYRRFNQTQKAWVNVVGHIVFLIPYALFMLIISWHYVLQSWGWQPNSNIWGTREGSANTGGLELVFLLKSLIPLGAVLLFIFAISDTLKQLLMLGSDAQRVQSENAS